MKRQIVLASQSPRRRELLKLLGLSFEVTSADVDETPRSGEEPMSLARRLARAKAGAAQAEGVKGLILAADTIVTAGSGNGVLGKPQDAAEAVRMLRDLRGRAHEVHSAITLLNTSQGRVWGDLCTSRVWMRAYSDEEIAEYVASGDPLDKAGAYAIQHTGFNPVGRLEGCFASVVGLPLCHLTRNLHAVGIRLSVSTPTVCQRHFDHRCPVYQQILHGLVYQIGQG
jgi:septum formation protein